MRTPFAPSLLAGLPFGIHNAPHGTKLHRAPMTAVLKDTVEILGLKATVTTAIELMAVVRQGLRSSSLESVSKEMNLSAIATDVLSVPLSSSTI